MTAPNGPTGQRADGQPLPVACISVSSALGGSEWSLLDFVRRAASLIRGPKRVWHLREFPPERTQQIWKLLVGALPTASIANSRAVAEAWRVAGFRPPAVVHNGVDLERFRPLERTGWIHEHLGL